MFQLARLRWPPTSCHFSPIVVLGKPRAGTRALVCGLRYHRAERCHTVRLRLHYSPFWCEQLHAFVASGRLGTKATKASHIYICLTRSGSMSPNKVETGLGMHVARSTSQLGRRTDPGCR